MPFNKTMPHTERWALMNKGVMLLNVGAGEAVRSNIRTVTLVMNQSLMNCWVHHTGFIWDSLQHVWLNPISFFKPYTPIISVMKVFDLIVEYEISITVVMDVLLWDIISFLGRLGLSPVLLVAGSINLNRTHNGWAEIALFHKWCPVSLHTLCNLTCVKTQCFLSAFTPCAWRKIRTKV